MSNYMKQEKINRRFKLIMKAIEENETEEELAEELGISTEAIRLFLRNYFDTNWQQLEQEYYNRRES